jgi:hypothetical protein
MRIKIMIASGDASKNAYKMGDSKIPILFEGTMQQKWIHL